MTVHFTPTADQAKIHFIPDTPPVNPTHAQLDVQYGTPSHPLGGITPDEVEPPDAPSVLAPGQTSPSIWRAMKAGAKKTVAQVAAPVFSGLTGGVAAITTRLPDVLDKVLAVAGVPEDKRVTPLKLLNAELTVNNAYWEKVLEKEGVSGVEKLLGKTVGGFAPGMLNWMGGVPLAAIEGATEGYKTGGVEGAIGKAVEETAKRYALGKVLEGIGLIKSAPIRRTLSGATLAGTTLAEGGTPGEALVQGLVGTAAGNKAPEGAQLFGRERAAVRRVLRRKTGVEERPPSAPPYKGEEPTVPTVENGQIEAGQGLAEPQVIPPTSTTDVTPGAKPVKDSSFLQYMWSTVREDVPGKPLVPTPQTFRQALVNRHVALYQAFDKSRPGGPLQQQLTKDIGETVRAINELEGISDPLEGRPTVPPEYQAAKAKRPSVLEPLTQAEKGTAERNAAFEKAQAKATATRTQQEEADAWYAGRTALPPAQEAPPTGKRVLRRKPEAPGGVAVPASEPVVTPAEPPVTPPMGATSAGVAAVPAVEPTPQGQTVPVGTGAKPKTPRGLEISILKTARAAGLTTDQRHDALEAAVGKRSIKGLSPEELQTAADHFQRTYGAGKGAPAQTQTPVVVAGQMTTMEAVVDEALQSVTKLQPQKRALRRRVRIGSASGVRNALHQMGRFFFGDLNTAPYYVAKVLDGGNEGGVFSRVLDRNIQDGNAIRADLVANFNRMARAAREEAGVTPDDLAVMSRAANPRPKTVEWKLPKTELIPVKLGGRTFELTWGRLLDIYGQTSQVIPETGEPIGRSYAKTHGLEIDKQFTGRLTDAEIDDLRSRVEQNPKAMAELDIEWKVVGPFRAQVINQVSQQAEGIDVATVPNWYHIEIGRGRRVPGKTVEIGSKETEPKPVDALLEAEGARGFQIDLLENQSILKSRRGGGRGPLVIRDFWERGNAVNHAAAEYAGFALPFRTARTLLNHPDIQRELDTRGYEEPRKLLTTLFSRIQGSERGAGGDVAILKRLRAGFYRAVINWSPQVWLPQPTSVLNYGAYADTKYLPMATVRILDPRDINEMMDNSPIAYERYHGGFSTMGLAESMESDAVLQALTGKNAWIDKSSIAMRVTDMMPLHGGWALAKAEFRDAQAGTMNPKGLSARWWKDKNIAGFEEGDQAWMSTIRERAEYLWQRSQQTWDPVNRSAISGTPNQALRTLFFFRSYHEKVVTMWNDALLDLKTGRSTKAEFAKRVSYPVASYMAEALTRSILLAAIFGDRKDLDDYGLALITSPLSAFPVFGPVMQAGIIAFAKAAEGKKQRRRNWDLLNSPMLDMVNETLDAVPMVAQAAGEWAEGNGEKAMKTAGGAMLQLAEPFAVGVFGLPVYNAQKLRRGWLAPEEEKPAIGGPTKKLLARRPPLEKRTLARRE